MSSKPSIAQIAEAAQVTSADVIRVLNHGGTSQTDWAIAHAIETITGRSAYELMLTAGRDAEVAAIWADSRDDQTETAPANPRAVYDEVVTVYPENTSPEETREVIPHHPGDTTEAPDEWETLQIQVWAAVADLSGGNCTEVDYIVADWTSIEEIRDGIADLLSASDHPRAARLRETYMNADLAA